MRDNNEMPGHLARRFQQIAVAVFLAEVGEAGFDLTPVQYAALSAIRTKPGIDQVTLAGLIAYDRTTITGVVDRLAQKGLLVTPAAATVALASCRSPMRESERCAASRRPSRQRNRPCCAASPRRRART